ncbi:MAG: hypothetical protein QOG73_3060, partial [Acetobacteraceae bacterium]|nr:hypothetical protein [Acetobacteraceae bacterium]
IEHGAGLIVARDFAYAEQRLAVRTTLAGFQIPLMGQEGRALHEERGEGGEREIGHAVGRVLAAPPVGQRFAVAAQSGEEAIQDRHQELES